MKSASTMTSSFDFEHGPEILDPKEMLELPRPGAGVVNPAGNLVFVSVTQWFFTEKKNIRWLSVSALDASVSPIKIELSLPSETVWLGDRTLGLIQKRPEDDTQCLMEYSITFDPQAQVLKCSHERIIGYLLCNDARDVKYSDVAKTLVFAADVYSDTDLSTVAAQDKKQAERDDSALVYDDTFARHWAEWCGPKRTALFAVSLSQGEGEENNWKLGSTYISPMQGTTHASPVYPFGGTDDFSLSKTHIVYAARDPDLPKAFHTRRNVYIAPIDGSEPPRTLTSGRQGETHNPDFSHNGNFVAWLEMSEDGNDADKLIITIYDLRSSTRYRLAENWDRSPDSLTWASDDRFLYLTAHEGGRAKIFAVELPDTPSKMDASIEASPAALTQEGFAYAPQSLPDGRIIFSQTTMSSPSSVWTISPSTASPSVLRGSQISELVSFADAGMQHKTLVAVEEVWFTGAEGRKVQGFVTLPPGFKKGRGRKWPAIMMVHGGPQAAWNDQWSTRWNPQVWAGQGYMVFTPNFTGSTGFGQAFVDAVAGDWGGAPFVDMRAGWSHFLSEYPEVDSSRVCAIGGSWGGYAINLIQGHPEWGFGFKGLVCHDGDFDSVFSGYQVDEQTITKHEWGGWPWQEQQRKLLEIMSPHMFVNKWSTPQLWLHGSNDFRVSETQSLAAFHALKQRGVPARLVIFPDETHFVTRPANALRWHYEVFRFLDQYVKRAQ